MNSYSYGVKGICSRKKNIGTLKECDEEEDLEVEWWEGAYWKGGCSNDPGWSAQQGR